MMLCDYLSLHEAIKSKTAIRKGIDNTPSEKHISNLKMLAEKIFLPIRRHFRTAIYISSGYRSVELNKAIGGSYKSQHCKGEAFDIDQDNKFSSVSNADIFNFIKGNLDFDQLIWEFGTVHNPAWVHISYNTTIPSANRREILMASKKQDKTEYEKYK